jgi:hypothetical protein
MKPIPDETMPWLVMGNFVLGTIVFVYSWKIHNEYIHGEYAATDTPIMLLVLLVAAIVFFDVKVAIESRKKDGFSVRLYLFFVIVLPILCVALLRFWIASWYYG